MPSEATTCELLDSVGAYNATNRIAPHIARYRAADGIESYEIGVYPTIVPFLRRWPHGVMFSRQIA